uniref:Uncharacterized protein n=1 Tax=Arundo donax TaxID=35708 RepID=A0A0A9F2A7_ARUDO
MSASLLRTLYSIFPFVGSSMTHLSFHFLSVSDRFKRGPWRSCRVDVEDSCRLTRSKLLCISPTISSHHPQQPSKNPNFGQIPTSNEIET